MAIDSRAYKYLCRQYRLVLSQMRQLCFAPADREPVDGVDFDHLEPRFLRSNGSANDLRAMFKGMLRDHLGVSNRDLYRVVFPDSKDVAPLDGLV